MTTKKVICGSFKAESSFLEFVLDAAYTSTIFLF